MPNDIAKSITGNDIKNGTLLVFTGSRGTYDVVSSSGYVSNSPAITDIQSKYDNRFDDPSYYYGSGSGVIGV